VVGPHIDTNAVTRLAMKENGRILNVSSKAGKVGLQNYSFYVASKFALEGMTSSWAKELKERQIIVNSLSPGMVNTKSFPKPPDKKGVRTSESIRDCLLFALTSSMGFTGHYVHADEYDMVIQQKGEAAANEAWKCIDETQFQVT
jgi:NAD(P)-dependent dehydrogenase (short-subunit alcohol dehydrogenase family)